MNRKDLNLLNKLNNISALVVEGVMGGFTSDPDATSREGQTWFWRDGDGRMLLGESYTNIFLDGLYSHSWRHFRPTTNIQDAWIVVDKLMSENFGITISVNHADAPVCRIFRADGSSVLGTGETVELAICDAALTLTKE